MRLSIGANKDYFPINLPVISSLNQLIIYSKMSVYSLNPPKFQFTNTWDTDKQKVLTLEKPENLGQFFSFENLYFLYKVAPADLPTAYFYHCSLKCNWIELWCWYTRDNITNPRVAANNTRPSSVIRDSSVLAFSQTPKSPWLTTMRSKSVA